MESFIIEGNQAIDYKNPKNTQRNGLSITDPCLGWKQTEEAILSLAERLQTL